MNRKVGPTEKPDEAFYKKNMSEIAPSWKERRELVRFLVEDSDITPISKNYLKD